MLLVLYDTFDDKKQPQLLLMNLLLIVGVNKNLYMDYMLLLLLPLLNQNTKQHQKVENNLYVNDPYDYLFFYFIVK